MIICGNHALGTVEARLIGRRVDKAGGAGAVAVAFVARLIEHDDLMMARIGDDPAPPAVHRAGLHLAGESQAIARRLWSGEVERARRQDPGLAGLGHELAHELDEPVGRHLAGLEAHERSLGIDERESGPGAYAVGAPQAKLGILDHGVGDVVARDRLRQLVGLLLGRELRRMHADDGDLIGKSGLQLAQRRKHVNAVDAAEGPEIENDEFAAEVGQRERCIHIEPLETLQVDVGCGGEFDMASNPSGWGAAHIRDPRETSGHQPVNNKRRLHALASLPPPDSPRSPVDLDQIAAAFRSLT